jgi:hypothetical protein
MHKICLLLVSVTLSVEGLAQTAAVPSHDTPAMVTSPVAAECESKAVDKAGKPLSGAARTSFMKKCGAEGSRDSTVAACEKKAVGENGRNLVGAARSAFIKKCVDEAGGSSGSTK